MHFKAIPAFSHLESRQDKEGWQLEALLQPLNGRIIVMALSPLLQNERGKGHRN